MVPGFSDPQLPHEVTAEVHISNSVFSALSLPLAIISVEFMPHSAFNDPLMTLVPFTSNNASGSFVLIPIHHISGRLPQGTLIINVHVFIDIKSVVVSLFRTNELLLFAFALTPAAKLLLALFILFINQPGIVELSEFPVISLLSHHPINP